MKIGLQTWGTDGDFFPFLALAIGLKEAGHQVTLAYTSIDGKDYSSRAEINGMELVKADNGTGSNGMTNPYAIDAKPGSFKEYSNLLDLYFEPLTEVMYTASEKLCQECDLVIGHAVCHTLLTAAEKHNTPRVSVVLTPLVVRSNYASPVGIEFGALLNSFLWSVGGIVATRKWFKRGNEIRKQEGLPPVRSLQKELFTSSLLTIVAASETLIPRPKDWGKHIQMAGFLNLESQNSNWQMPPELKEFIESDEPPVYMTFGSCMQFDVEASTRLLVEATKLSGKRAIIQSNWGQVQKPNDPNIYCTHQLPHSEVFPHCSLVVHHGGAGTTQAALLAGKPSVVVAHGFDQKYWGKQLQESMVGGNVLTKTTSSPKLIANEIQSVLGTKRKSAASAILAQKMLKENGVDTAISLIESLSLPK